MDDPDFCTEGKAAHRGGAERCEEKRGGDVSVKPVAALSLGGRAGKPWLEMRWPQWSDGLTHITLMTASITL